jgi:Thiolase, N-terminal domain.
VAERGVQHPPNTQSTRIHQENRMSDPVVIVSVARTPLGGFQGDLASLTTPQLGAVAIRSAVERARLKPEQVEQ